MMQIMDVSSLKNKAAHRRQVASSPGWKCTYCNKIFVRETMFLQHKCKGKRRLDLLKTPVGQSALASYQQWLKSKRHSIQNPDTFMNSRFFVSFVKFAEYCIKVNMDANLFIEFITKCHPDIGPTLWCSNPVYGLFLKYYDNQHSPWEQVADSLAFIEKQAEILECPKNEVFQSLGFSKILEAVRLKKLSPWFIYTYDAGLSFLRSLDHVDYSLFEEIINTSVWTTRFSENRILLTEMEKIVNDRE